MKTQACISILTMQGKQQQLLIKLLVDCPLEEQVLTLHCMTNTPTVSHPNTNAIPNQQHNYDINMTILHEILIKFERFINGKARKHLID